jgi:hypothetical protein
MKKKIMTLLIITALLMLNGCGTINIRNHNYGNVKGLDRANVVILVYDNNIDVKRVNGERVYWDMTTGDKIIKMPEGEYVFIIDYKQLVSVNAQGNTYAYLKDAEIGPYNLEAGKKYRINYVRTSDNKVSFFIRLEM